MSRTSVLSTVLAALVLLAFQAAARAESFDGAYRGSIVCAKLTFNADILRAPFDMVVTGKSVMFARPVFDRLGNRVVGSELGTGTVEDNGALKLTSSWSAGVFSYQGAYAGTINGKTGALTGTQAWTMPRGKQTRDCMIAYARRAP